MFATKHAAGACALAAMMMSSFVLAEGNEEMVLLPVCSSDAIEHVHRTRAPTVVVVRAPGAHGTPMVGLGFVFGSRRHVATAFAIVETGRGIEVELGDESREAVVVAFNRARDLAILRLERPQTRAPLPSAHVAPRIGEPVLALGRTSDASDGDVVLTPGIISAKRGSELRSNALDGSQLDWGGPVLDCSGELVGIATADGERIAPAAALEDLLGTIDEQAEPYESGWSLLHPTLAFHGQLGVTHTPGFDVPDGWLGFGVGTALIGNDRWYFPFEARVLMLTGPRSPLVERSGVRVQLATGAGYRFLLANDPPTYLIPTIGVVGSYDSITTRTTRLVSFPGCERGAACPLGLALEEYQASDMRLMPTAGLKLQLGFATVGYEFALDVKAPQQSTHQLSVGLQF
jgi:hypothetical protein